ncbi:MAG: beta-lactamase family protein [Flavobacteriales bacterium]|nr:beta-lactamase family protein [Flavobacteriales bacterium]
MSKQARRILRIAFVAASIGSLFLVPWRLVWARVRPLPSTVQAQVDQAVEYGFEGVVVYVDAASKAPAWYTAGWHERSTKVPARPDALFKIGSINKLYTAVATTKLAHAGRLDLDAPLATYFPELVGRIEHAERITLRMLVQHRSGIPNFTDTPDYWAHPKESDQEKLELVLDRPADFEPGMDHAYCNTNYLLLSMLMDRTLGYPRSRYIQVEILEPLGLQHTYFSLGEVDLADVMSGYHIGHPHDLKSDEQGMLATAADVGTFVRALNDGSAFEGGERAIYSSIYELGHNGWVPGYQSFAHYRPQLDAVVVAFYNTTDPDLLLWNTAEIVNGRIVRILAAEHDDPGG